MRNGILLSSFALLLNIFCHHSTEKKVKKITWYNVDGHVEYNKAPEVFKSSINPYLVQQYDLAGKLIRENGYDYNGNEDNVVEYKYDENNKLVEKISYKNFYMRPLGRTYSEKYVYRNNLLVETYYHYGTGDGSGLFAKSERSYNELDQVIKFQYNAFNDDGVDETRTYNWKDKFIYIEKRVNAQGNIERHFVKLDDKKNELEHRYSLDPQASDETGPFPLGVNTIYDEYGNEVKRISGFEGTPREESVYEYRYENGYWNYRTFRKAGGVMYTQLRKIEYY